MLTHRISQMSVLMDYQNATSFIPETPIPHYGNSNTEMATSSVETWSACGRSSAEPVAMRSSIAKATTPNQLRRSQERLLNLCLSPKIAQMRDWSTLSTRSMIWGPGCREAMKPPITCMSRTKQQWKPWAACCISIRSCQGPCCHWSLLTAPSHAMVRLQAPSIVQP